MSPNVIKQRNLLELWTVWLFRRFKTLRYQANSSSKLMSAFRPHHEEQVAGVRRATAQARSIQLKLGPGRDHCHGVRYNRLYGNYGNIHVRVNEWLSSDKRRFSSASEDMSCVFAHRIHHIVLYWHHNVNIDSRHYSKQPIVEINTTINKLTIITIIIIIIDEWMPGIDYTGVKSRCETRQRNLVLPET